METDVHAWDQTQCVALIDELLNLQTMMLRTEQALAPVLQEVANEHLASARNLAHFLAMRQHDLRLVQRKLSQVGLSSLGHSESHVMANLDKVLDILHRLADKPMRSPSGSESMGISASRSLCGRNAERLLGIAPPQRGVRIMVTLPSEAEGDYGLVRQLVRSGMDVARINCSHDAVGAWKKMAAHVRRAALAEQRSVKILMDLGGPKFRTAGISPGPAVLKLRPQRDAFGTVLQPARLFLTAEESIDPSDSIHPSACMPARLGVNAKWLERVSQGEIISCRDARDKRRRFVVAAKDAAGIVLLESNQTSYLVPETKLKRKADDGPTATSIHGIRSQEGRLQLKRGMMLRITPFKAQPSPPSVSSWASALMPHLECTLPTGFSQLFAGERIFFDDGRIGGVIRSATESEIVLEITQARDDGERLGADKGINLPDSQLSLPALTEKDITDLKTIVQEADMVGLSFVHQSSDVEALCAQLRSLGAQELGIVLKIETRRAFENLPNILFAAMKWQNVGVMIARGDLAVECGYERLAEVQEEILWAAEAAHLPVIWATQVLDTLAKTGLPSRAEITDAAMGERAECVMLNKGPHITEAIRTLDDILRRMQFHQSKKYPLLRALKAWRIPGGTIDTGP